LDEHQQSAQISARVS